VDLFASPFSENLAKSSAGQLIFEAAKLVQFGRPEAAPAAEGPVPPAAVAPAAPAARD
jgi:hypothetical protein